jgi:hypothetical protein
MGRLLVFCSLIALVPAASAAQVPLVPGALSVAAGVELPQEDGSPLLKQGLTLQVGYRAPIPLTPFAVRAEGGLSQFGGKTGLVPGGTVTQGTTRILSGGVAAEMTVLPLILFRGYVIAGASYTRSTSDVRVAVTGLPVATVPYSETGFGFSGGIGAEFSLPFLPAAGLEARYRYTPGALGGAGGLRSIPITLRVTF